LRVRSLSVRGSELRVEGFGVSKEAPPIPSATDTEEATDLGFGLFGLFGFGVVWVIRVIWV